jgi:UDP-2-acetamido-3-amino-2,3-dideoxy-glucuronate N-acetyltransferase
VEIHESAWVEAPCSIGRGSRIWHFSHVQAEARIGAGCSLGQNVSVGPRVVIGAHVRIQNNVSVYTGCEIEDYVFLGPSCIFTNDSTPRAELGPPDPFERTRVRRGASIGANATIVSGVTLGRYCFVAAGAVVTRDVPDYALMVGAPARQAGWMSRHGRRLEGVAPGAVATCPESGLRYRLADGGLHCLDLGEDAPLPPA